MLRCSGGMRRTASHFSLSHTSFWTLCVAIGGWHHFEPQIDLEHNILVLYTVASVSPQLTQLRQNCVTETSARHSLVFRMPLKLVCGRFMRCSSRCPWRESGDVSPNHWTHGAYRSDFVLPSKADITLIAESPGSVQMTRQKGRG